jgi:hypothetical protein
MLSLETWVRGLSSEGSDKATKKEFKAFDVALHTLDHAGHKSVL